MGVYGIFISKVPGCEKYRLKYCVNLEITLHFKSLLEEKHNHAFIL